MVLPLTHLTESERTQGMERFHLLRPVLVAACAVVLIGFADAASDQATQAPSTTFWRRKTSAGNSPDSAAIAF